MKVNDLLQNRNDVHSVADHFRYYSEMGVEANHTVTAELKKLATTPGAADLARSILVKKAGVDPDAMLLIKEALQPKISDYVAAFSLQLMLSGLNMHERFMMDPSTQILAQNLVQQLHQAVSWTRYGMNVFNLTHSLAAGLILTEPPPMTEETFQLPFPAFAVVLPNEFLPFSWRGAERKWSNLIWVHRFMSPVRGWTYQITVDCEGLSLFRREGIDKFAEVDAIETELRAFEDDPKMTSDDDLTMSTAVRIVRNLVLWINAHGLPASEQSSRKKKARRDDPKDRNTPTTWFLGREVKLAPEIRKMATEAVLGQSKSTAVEGWRVRMKHVVRGHWKMQFHGKERAERKRIWVEPYWRGPEGAAAWTHLYQPKEE